MQAILYGSGSSVSSYAVFFVCLSLVPVELISPSSKRMRLLVFAYYNRLTSAQKRMYRKSDEITAVTVPDAFELHSLVSDLENSLFLEDRQKTEDICRSIIENIVARLSVSCFRVNILAVRPAGQWGELHGLYEPAQGRASAKITIWMRTVKHRRVVAFRSFFRTLLHELCHYLDYELFLLPESFHTEGFYKRESSLFHQLSPER